MSLRMRAQAALATELRAGRHGHRSHIARLRSDPPLVLRAAAAKEPEPWTEQAAGLARVSLAAAAAGPIGGDQYSLDVHVGAGSTLVLTEVSATLLLPGHDGACSRTDVRIRVDAAGTLIWLPEPIIVAARCDHVNDVRVELAADARLLMREQILLGRHGEPAGRLRQRVRVRRASRPLFIQDLDLAASNWTSPAVGLGSPAVGSVLMVDPIWRHHTPAPAGLPGRAAVMPLEGGAVLVTALAEDNLALRRLLTTGLNTVGQH